MAMLSNTFIAKKKKNQVNHNYYINYFKRNLWALLYALYFIGTYNTYTYNNGYYYYLNLLILLSFCKFYERLLHICPANKM